MGGWVQAGGDRLLIQLSESRPLLFLHALLHEVKPTSEAGPLGEQANTGLSLCVCPWRYVRKENRGWRDGGLGVEGEEGGRGDHAYLIRDYISHFQGGQTGTE